MTGIDVEHIRSEWTFESYFYKRRSERAKYANRINGFPIQQRNWCVGRLKTEIIDKQYKNAIAYIGIAADEPKRIARHSVPGKVIPLVQIGWDEAYCRKWCEEHDLLSPIYTTAARGGCWFCHNQSIEQLRLLRRNHPEYWQLLLKWDADSPVSFKPNGHTVHDYDRRFGLEDEGIIVPGETFFWRMLDEDIQTRLF